MFIVDNFRKFGETVPLKSKNAERLSNFVEKILKSSKRKPSFLETDRGKEFFNSTFRIFLGNNNIKHYSRKTLLCAVFAKKFFKTIRNVPMRPVFEKSDSNWIDILSLTTKQCNILVQTSTNLTPIRASS